MNGTMNSASKLNAYRANAVSSASPENLVVMMYDGAIRFLGAAIRAFDYEDPLDFNFVIHTNITKTQAIIRELGHALDMENGGELGQNLASLYDYFDTRLQEANIKKDRAIVQEVLERISELRDAWSTSFAQNKGAVPAENTSKTAPPPDSYAHPNTENPPPDPPGLSLVG